MTPQHCGDTSNKAIAKVRAHPGFVRRGHATYKARYSIPILLYLDLEIGYKKRLSICLQGEYEVPSQLTNPIGQSDVKVQVNLITQHSGTSYIYQKVTEKHIYG